MRVLRGPTENKHRPSIDVLFRSAAASYSSSVCGVLLSGTLDDGVAGLVAIHDAGGVALAQDPDDALFPDMPRNAIRTGAVDGIYAAGDVVPAIRQWISRPRQADAVQSLPQDEREVGTPSVFTCPDCGGTLWEVDEEAVLRFRCRTGHAYTENTMLSAQGQTLESALWAALRALEERHDLLRRLVARTHASGTQRTKQRLERQAASVQRDIARVQQAVSGLLESSTNEG
jgi:two-component system, chemotaxis family, protein-glutamate methylesterase/glutaminase